MRNHAMILTSIAFDRSREPKAASLLETRRRHLKSLVDLSIALVRTRLEKEHSTDVEFLRPEDHIPPSPHSPTTQYTPVASITYTSPQPPSPIYHWDQSCTCRVIVFPGVIVLNPFLAHTAFSSSSMFSSGNSCSAATPSATKLSSSPAQPQPGMPPFWMVSGWLPGSGS